MEAHGKPYRIEYYITPEGESFIDEFFEEINETHQGKILRWFGYLKEQGPNLPRPYADVLEGKIRELRIAISHHQYRFLYFFHGKTIVITHGFLKKTDKVPQVEIERASRYMADWLHCWGREEGGE
ncbi:MAG: type II toxin-antitoxin system RelE/ParE family toxin [Elusimicrobia bacterium]|nr:type II toxin-antitoxin system RelE/ParE family toxin [Elusimicrobiota bacterium]